MEFLLISYSLPIIATATYLIIVDPSPYDNIATYFTSGCRVSVPDNIKHQLIENRVPEISFKFPGKKFKNSKLKGGYCTRYCKQDGSIKEFQFLTYSEKIMACIALAVYFFLLKANVIEQGYSLLLHIRIGRMPMVIY